MSLEKLEVVGHVPHISNIISEILSHHSISPCHGAPLHGGSAEFKNHEIHNHVKCSHCGADHVIHHSKAESHKIMHHHIHNPDGIQTFIDTAENMYGGGFWGNVWDTVKSVTPSIIEGANYVFNKKDQKYEEAAKAAVEAEEREIRRAELEIKKAEIAAKAAASKPKPKKPTKKQIEEEEEEYDGAGASFETVLQAGGSTHPISHRMVHHRIMHHLHRAPNAWDHYEHAHKDEGETHAQLRAGYHHRGGRAPNVWDRYEHAHKGQGESRAQMHAGYHRGGNVMGAAHNPWVEFMKEHAGQKIPLHELSRMYHSQHGGRAPNAWDKYEHAHKGEGETHAQMDAGYHHRGGRAPNAWDRYEHAHKGQHETRAQMHAGYQKGGALYH